MKTHIATLLVEVVVEVKVRCDFKEAPAKAAERAARMVGNNVRRIGAHVQGTALMIGPEAVKPGVRSVFRPSHVAP